MGDIVKANWLIDNEIVKDLGDLLHMEIDIN